MWSSGWDAALSLLRVQVQSPVGELRSYDAQHTAKKIKKTRVTIAIFLPLESRSNEIFYELPFQLKD